MQVLNVRSVDGAIVRVGMSVTVPHPNNRYAAAKPQIEVEMSVPIDMTPEEFMDMLEVDLLEKMQQYLSSLNGLIEVNL